MTTATKYKTYSKYKPSGIDWLGDIPVGWEVKRLRYLASLQKGKKPEENTESVDGLPYLTMDFLRGQEEPTKFMPVSESVVVKDGDILLLWDGANAGEFVNGVEGILSSTMAKVSFDKHKVNSRYCRYFLESFEKKLRELTIGMGIPHVSGDIVKDCITPIPSGLDQKNIADFLDCETAKIDDVMAKKQKMMELLKEKRQALITHAVTKGLNPKVKMKASGIEWLGDIPEGWEIKRLKYISNSRVSNVDKKSEDEIKVKLCNYIDVYKNEFINEGIDFMEATAKNNQIEIFELKQGDVIITKDSETPDDIGVPAYVKLKNTKKLVCGYHLAIITPKQGILLGKYLFRLFQSKLFRSYFEIHCNGVTRFGLDTYSVFNANILLPSLSEQQCIIDYIDRETANIDEMMKKVEMQIEKLKEYRQALITSAVTGKIKV